MEQVPVKTKASRRVLPLVAILREELLRMYVDRHGVLPVAHTDQDAIGRELVFLSTTGTPVDPKNFAHRAFHKLCDEAGVRHIRFHDKRHTTATLLKNLRVPDRDIQLILGHAHVTTTQQLYQHADLAGQTEALTEAEQQLLAAVDVAAKSAAISEFSTGESTIFRALTPGGPGGARTLDTLLKSHVFIEVILTSTPNLGRVRTLAYAHILASVAVKNCCKTISRSNPGNSLVAEWMHLLCLLRATEVQLMTLKSFPFTLLPTTPGYVDKSKTRNKTGKEAMT